VGFVGKAGVAGVIPAALANAASASVNGAIFNTFGCVAAAATTSGGGAD